MWHIFFIGWVSWSWKGTLINNLRNLNHPKLHFPLSYKTRPIRETETNWVDAHFVTPEVFYAWVQAWEFLEYAVVHQTDYYWTKFSDVLDNWIHLWKIVIKEIDVIWLQDLKETHPHLDEKYSTIFLDIPIDLISQRIQKRWALMTNGELENRLNSAKMEINKSKELFNHIIDATQTPEQVLNDILKILNIE